ncbi:hypothetical protein ARHIZOSPH14_30070 [Agromyces rhizosphaerae]|uniref:Lipoprotein LpqB N-terminal domain-containing protein n=1 Tax=Agromyces rhizosphaerae TaxID=88374 RepID=A0A9W6CYR8_9MICO|nr:hypothetical protein [Agromyces rhizosphaerae]GLI28765.1 hypothetical protein ARHIZOSPH14_30070 [Agromyces rhizosphaerae]
MNAAPARADRALIGIGIAIALVVVAAVIAVLVRGAPEQLDESTPEGVVQRYSAAVIAGDEQAALEYLVPELAESCERVERFDDEVRVSLVATTERESSADVEVAIVTTYGGGLFGPDEYRSDGSFDLVRVDDEWRIESVPWELAVCAPGGVG